MLLEVPGFAVPAGARMNSVVTRDGVSLRTAFWPARKAPNGGIVLILQGRAEFIEKYGETVESLLVRGYAVLAFDWRGQGGSDRALADGHVGHVRHFDDFRLDHEAVLDRFRAEWDGARRRVALAHSMGGCVALTGAHEGWLGADRLVCVNPMLGLSIVPQPRLVGRLARALRRVGLGGRMVPGGVRASISTLPFLANRLSTDEARYARNADLAARLGAGAIGSPSLGWLAAASEAMERLSRPGVAASITAPTLAVLSDRDPVCSTPVMRAFAEAVPGARVVVLPDARHEILMETDAILARFWEAFDAFVAEPAEFAEAAKAGIPADEVAASPDGVSAAVGR